MNTILVGQGWYQGTTESEQQGGKRNGRKRGKGAWVVSYGKGGGGG